jgi:uncharacterized protein YjbI with pentapeptide repeats
MLSRHEPLAVLCLLALAACVLEDEVGSRGAAIVLENGRDLNGRDLNGRDLNGRDLNGSSLGSTLLWTSLEGVQLGGSILEETWLEGTELVGRNGNGSIFRGAGFEQSEFAAVSDAGHEVRLRLRHVDAPDAGDDRWRYWVEYRETDQQWYPLCLDDADEAASAIALDGWWNPEAGVTGGGAKNDDPLKMTFACQGGTLGKCVDLGYEPWSEIEAVSLDPHHQACVRAVRADYCGDGVAHTTDGKLINIYDGIGIQPDTEDWLIEAEWDGAGARCFSQNNRALSHLSCFKERATSNCGNTAHFASGTLVMTEIP